jgi:hypothetical protein
MADEEMPVITFTEGQLYTIDVVRAAWEAGYREGQWEKHEQAEFYLDLLASR